MSSVEIPTHLTFEMTHVARYHAFNETAGGFAVPDPGTLQDDRHFEFSLPGAIGYPAVIYYRTRRTGTPPFTVRINAATVTEYTFVDGDEAERTWHEIIPSNTLQPDTNELVLAVYGGRGSVVFGDVVILYTSNHITIPVPVVTAGSGGRATG
jgi:hypothetical protein